MLSQILLNEQKLFQNLCFEQKLSQIFFYEWMLSQILFCEQKLFQNLCFQNFI